MHDLLRRTALVATAGLALGSLAGCGGGDKTNDSSASTDASQSVSAGSSPSATSSSPSGSSSGSSPGSSSTLTKDNFVATLEQAIQDRRSAHVTMSLSGNLRASGDVSYASSGPSMQLTMSTGDGKGASAMDMRFVDGTMYLSLPGLTPKGKFIAVTKDDPTFGSIVKQLTTLGPDGAVAMMKKGVKQFEHEGTTVIEGTSYDHYRVTLDPSAAIAGMGLGAAPGGAPKSVTEDLYLDADNLMRRAVTTVSGQKLTVDVTDWGKPVHISAPPASQITKAPSTGTSAPTM